MAWWEVLHTTHVIKVLQPGWVTGDQLWPMCHTADANKLIIIIIIILSLIRHILAVDIMGLCDLDLWPILPKNWSLSIQNRKTFFARADKTSISKCQWAMGNEHTCSASSREGCTKQTQPKPERENSTEMTCKWEKKSRRLGGTQKKFGSKIQNRSSNRWKI